MVDSFAMADIKTVMSCVRDAVLRFADPPAEYSLTMWWVLEQ